MAPRYDFSAQASDLIDVIRVLQLSVKNREIAVIAAICALSSPQDAAEIAERCGLHMIQDEYYLAYLEALLSSGVSIEKRAPWVRRFYLQAIAYHESGPVEVRSALHYSLANFEQQAGNFSTAITNYNIARKLNKDYLVRDYYLCEVAATLFFSGHYRCSASAYVNAFQLRDTAQVAICTADALIYSRQYELALDYLRVVGVTVTGDDFETAEAAIKIWLVESLMRLSDERVDAWTGATGRYGYWSSLVTQSLGNNRPDVALVSCLMLGFIAESDVEVWSTAILLGANSSQAELTLAVFSCAVWRCGFEVYASVRDTLVKQDVAQEVLTEFDAIAKHLDEIRPNRTKKKVTIRVAPGLTAGEGSEAR